MKWEEGTADDIPDIFNDPLRVFNAFHIIRARESKNPWMLYFNKIFL